MKTRQLLFFALMLLVGSAVATDYYTGIRPIIERRCLHCHSGGGVSFAFGDLEASYNFRSAMANAVAARRMPPWMAAPNVQHYQADLSLSDAEIAAFADWAAANFPKGDVKQYRATPANVSAFKADVQFDVSGSKGFLPDQNARDDYHCFLAKWPVKQSQYVRGIEFIPGNLRIAHHAILYVIDGKFTAALDALDAAEPGPGYRCFGGPLPDRAGDPKVAAAFEKRFPGAIKNIQQGNFWLGHWAPGMSGYSLPKDTGILINANSIVIVQMHYFNGFARNQTDQITRIGVQLAKSVKKPAFNWPLSNIAWLDAANNKSLVVPAKQKTSVFTQANLAGLDTYLSAYAGVPMQEISGLEIHSANLHMHLIGAAGQVTLIGPKGEEPLLHVPRYEFGWQRDFVFDAPKIVPLNQLKQWQIRVDCTFANPTNEPVYGGYGSNQEMCYNFSLISIARKN